jgi:hypothetical protein
MKIFDKNKFAYMRPLISYFKYPHQINYKFNKINSNTLLIIIIMHCFFYYSASVHAQTNPIAQNLTYSQNFGTGTFTTMPTGMAAWTVTGSPKNSQSSAESSVANGNAAITAATSTQLTGGCYGYATSNNGRFYIQTSSNATNGTSQCAAAIVTTGLQSIKVSYDIEMISSEAKTIGVILQYRIGTSGSWTTVSGGVYSHNSSDRSAGQVDNFANLELPTAVNNNSVVQLRWAIWRGSESGNSSGIAIDNISITGTGVSESYYFRSKQTGNWNSTSTWQMSTDGSNWSNATYTPNYKCKTITIQSGHIVTLTASDTIDELIINGTFIYGDYSGSTLTIHDESGIDVTLNGTFDDSGPNSIAWQSGTTWVIGSSGTLIRTRSTSANSWRDHFDGGISNINASANWIIRKTGSDSPTLSSTGGMYYPNVKIENNTGTLWTTGSSSSFTGSSDYPRIKGDLDIGGNGSGDVSFMTENTNASAITVEGDFTVKSGSTIRNNGTGFEIKGNLIANGTINYGASNGRAFIFGGSNSQTISGNGAVSIYDLTINKTGNDLTLSRSLVIDHQLSLTNKNVFIGTNDITIASTATISGGSSSSYIVTNSTGKIKKKLTATGLTFTFPTGDGAYYSPFISTLNSGTLGANAEVGVRVVNSAEPHSTGYTNYINRYWVVTTTEITNANAEVNYVYNEYDIHGSESTFVAARWNATFGLINIGTNNGTTNTATGTAVTSVGNFTVAGICNLEAIISHSDPDNVFCQGESDTLTVNNAASYLWSNLASTQSIVATEQGTYSVTITDVMGCASSASEAITVNSLPNADAGENDTICIGDSTTLTAGGGSGYAWSTGGNLASITVKPASTTVYIVTVTNSEGCSATDSVIVFVMQSPRANAGENVNICRGKTITLTATGGVSYNWSTGGNTPSINVSPTSNTNYIVTVTNTNGCSAKDFVTVNVSSVFPVADAGSDITVCADSFATLTASGGSFYHWNTGANTAITNVSPISSTVYTVSVTNGNGCSSTDNVMVTVSPHLKRYTVTGSGLNCSDGSAVLIALSGSELGVNYQLLLNGNAVGNLKAGTGGILYFGGQDAGTYTIQGKNAVTSCLENMIGSVIK